MKNASNCDFYKKSNLFTKKSIIIKWQEKEPFAINAASVNSEDVSLLNMFLNTK